MSDLEKVVLLKSERGSEAYRRVLESAGFDVAVVPVLEFRFVNGEGLVDCLEHAARYAAMALTSPRAVEAVVRTSAQALWGDRPVYAVAPATARRAGAAGLAVAPCQVGSGAALARCMLERGIRGEVLFPCGDRRREELPAILRAAGVDVHEVVAYETRISPPVFSGPPPSWAVFFSPSGVEAALAAPDLPWNSFRRAAIGATTADALQAAGWPPSAVALDPSPAGLLDALRQARTSSRQ